MKPASSRSLRNVTARPRGFTLVELVIVIVVLAILAAISIASYQHIQDRAYNSSVALAARTLINSVYSYHAENGKYPPMPSEATIGADDRVCFGRGYTDHDGDGVPDCGNSNYPSVEYPPFTAALTTLVNQPDVQERKIPAPAPYETGTFTGVTMIRQDAFTVDGESKPYYIMFVLTGHNQDCGHGVVEEKSNTERFPTMIKSSNRWSWSDERATMCVISLPNP
ncbi:hypothetical protein CR983_02370 [Candidatus Saccharibacteria bacterium]|nr:MAG: hypothetical protein CR983_02370 [Candidatus Saccharibacteria bacterium]